MAHEKPQYFQYRSTVIKALSRIKNQDLREDFLNIWGKAKALRKMKPQNCNRLYKPAGKEVT